jgi:superfamily II DNA/RNA helicase
MQRRASNTTNGAKADAVMTMIRRFLQTCDHSGFCCFSDFIGNGIDIIARLLTEAGIEFALIDGKTPKEARDSAVRRFNAGEVRVILLSRAGGEGIDLLRCKKLVVMEPTWNMSKLLQIEGRGVRRGALSYLPEAEREIEIVTLRVSLDNGEPTGDQTVAMIAMRKMPCVTAFLGRLQRLCDPLAAFRKAAAGDAVPRAAAASAVDMNRTEFAAWKVADDARFLRADGTRMSYEERKAKREADFAASREQSRNAYRERMIALRQKWRDEAKAKSREAITAAAATGSGETPTATALPSSAAAESEVAASAADA